MELLKKIAVNLPHVLTQDLEPIPVPVMKVIVEMGKHVKVCIVLKKNFLLKKYMSLIDVKESKNIEDGEKNNARSIEAQDVPTKITENIL